MQEAWHHVQPNNYYRLATQKWLSNVDQQLLQYLYQPIIGPDATRLYQAWGIDLEMNHQQTSDPQIHAALLQRLAISLPAFYEARKKLEAIGLLRTYVEIVEGTNEFFYTVQAPLPAESFFQDAILRVLLLDAVGPAYFDQVVERFTYQAGKPKKAQEITQKFMDVFQFSTERLASQNISLEQAAARVQTEQPTEPQLKSTSFDWMGFTESLNPFLVQMESLKQHQKTLVVLHDMYQLDEWTLKKLVEENADPVTNELDIKSLEKAVQRSFKRPLGAKEAEKPDTEQLVSLEKPSDQRQKTLRAQGFSPQEIAVIEASENLAPMAFLTSIRVQHHGTVTQGEQATVQRILAEMNLPTAVVNILIHYVLIVKELSTLQANFTLTVANSWARAEIQAPEAAILKVRQLTQQDSPTNAPSGPRKNTHAPRYANRTQRTTRKETLPEWAQDNYQAPLQEKTKNPVSTDQLKRLEERRNKLLNRQNGGEV